MSDVRYLYRGEEPFYARAHTMAEDGCSQDQIAERLEEEYPDLPVDTFYLNAAAEAIMGCMLRGQQTTLGLRTDHARLRVKGLPASLADRNAAARAHPHRAAALSAAEPFVGQDEY